MQVQSPQVNLEAILELKLKTKLTEISMWQDISGTINEYLRIIKNHILWHLQINLFGTGLQKNGPSCIGQVGNPWPQTPQRQPVTKHGTPL